MTTIIWLLIAIVTIILAIRFIKKPKKSQHRPKPMSHFNGAHDCGLRALHNVLPMLPNDEVRDAFMQCADRWPNAGISNVEFNVALRYMKIFDRFEYNDSDGQKVENFSSDSKGAYILLINGHFTTIKSGSIVDTPNYERLNPKSVVYCSWKLVA